MKVLGNKPDFSMESLWEQDGMSQEILFKKKKVL